jgi:hypothetical protein
VQEAMSGYILTTLTKEQREAVIGAVCPWCAHKIPAGSISTANGWDSYHYIDGQKPACKAQALRDAIYSADRAVEAQAERDRELLEYIA